MTAVKETGESVCLVGSHNHTEVTGHWTSVRQKYLKSFMLIILKMRCYWLRVASSPGYNSKAHIFAFGHYRKTESGEDEFSKQALHFYKYGNFEPFFFEKFKDLIERYFMNANPKFDYMTLYPTRKQNGFNTYMNDLLRKVSETTGMPYKQILRRNKDIEPNHSLKTFEERKKNVIGSIDVLEDVQGKRLLVVDNTSTTGISLIDVTNQLIAKGATTVVCLCLSLSDKEIEMDFDLNLSLGRQWNVNKIIATFKSKKIQKEAREEWKLAQPR